MATTKDLLTASLDDMSNSRSAETEVREQPNAWELVAYANRTDRSIESSTSNPSPGDDDDDEEAIDDDDVDSQFVSRDRENTPLHAGEKETRDLSKRDNAKVQVGRFLVLAMLLGVGAALSAFSYIVLRNQDNMNAANDFNLTVNAIEENLSFRAFNLNQALQGLSQELTARARTNHSSSDFPFVTVPYFEVSGRHVWEEGLVETVMFAPLLEASQVSAWLDYSASNLVWLETSAVVSGTGFAPDSRTPFLFERESQYAIVPTSSEGPFLPLWQMSPPPSQANVLNFDLLSSTVFKTIYTSSVSQNVTVVSDVLDLHDILGNEAGRFLDSSSHSIVIQPVFSSLSDGSPVKGIVLAVLSWDRYMAGIAPAGAPGIVVVLGNVREDAYAYEQHGKEFTRTDTLPVSDVMSANLSLAGGNQLQSSFTLQLYATSSFQAAQSSSTPAIFAALVAVGFLVIAAAFLAYDCFVQSRNNKIVSAAARSTAIISSLFPPNVHDRLFVSEQTPREARGHANSKTPRRTRQRPLDTVLPESNAQASPLNAKNVRAVDESSEADDEDMYKTKPIADLFPNATILFADIAGFTAWSSTREPSQVFILLETVYRAFDLIAKQRGVFKVETIGDCYVAACGLPQPRKDHAVVMARFARDCMRKMDQLTKKLEVTLGPDTADLCMRMGLHSGPVTGGVLRGERSRFQLFGDTMNTASRVETTGERGRIQISHETADALAAEGKAKWFKPRVGKVVAKGKGEIQTYWLRTPRSGSSAISRASGHSTDNTISDSEESESYSSSSDDIEDDDDELLQVLVSDKVARLIDWNVDVLMRLAQQIVVRRKATTAPPSKVLRLWPADDTRPIDEVQEIIVLPGFVPAESDAEKEVALDSKVQRELRDFVMNIAIMHRDNPFHNFEHASHVMMSVVKFMSRIVAPNEHDQDLFASVLHNRTYGITSDPLTQFACAFSALIHNVDHSGVPNTQLVKERTQIAHIYQNKSIAEQNSVDLAWGLLMDDSYDTLRSALFASNEDLNRFRQLVVNAVLATDIVDKELKSLRDARWDRAFSESAILDPANLNRKATIVIEHLLQASDVSHTMQHWHVYRKWNERLFAEMYKAHKEGRADRDPSEFWYEGELKFFDYYIIPLAKKLKDCGGFGVSSEEGLDYAKKNRQEWERQGKDLVSEMLFKAADQSRPQQLRKTDLLKSVPDYVKVNNQEPNATVKVGNNHVSESSVAGAFKNLMAQVAAMEHVEQRLAAENSLPPPLLDVA